MTWRRKILIGVPVVAVATLVGGFIGGSFWLKSYLHSDAFRAMLGEKTSAFCHGEGQYLSFHWSGLSVYSDGYAARGHAGAPFTTLRADQLRAEFYPRAMFRRAWQINDVEIQRLQLSLGTSTNRPGAPPVSAGPTTRSAWIPDKLDLRQVRIQDVNLDWAPPGRAGSLRQVRATITPEGSAWLLHGTGGQLRQTNWPALHVESLKLRYHHPELFVTEAQLALGENENVSVTGQITFDQRPLADLVVKFTGISVTPFLPEDWRAKLKGQAVGDARIMGPLDNPDAVAVVGKLHLVSGQLQALPVLDRIAAFTRTIQFRQFTLHKASAEFSWAKPKLTVSRLVIESEGLLRVEGGFVVQQRQLDGLFQVGVTPGSLRWLPGSQSRVFTVERNGYVWTEMRLTGPVDNLKEDLSSRLIAAAGNEVIEGVTGTVERGAKDLLDLLKPFVP